MSGDDHRSQFDLDSLHSKEACLTKCKGCARFRSSKCSYRQSGYDQAEAHKTVYNYPAYKSLCGDGTFKTGAYQYVNKKGKTKVYPPKYSLNKKRPNKGDWDIKGKNFKSWVKPYWHNYHHIIPAGIFNTAIDNTGDTDQFGPLLPELIRGGLLKAKFSIHHKRNVVILPQGLNVAKALKLPRHLRGDEMPEGKKQKFNHPEYNTEVESKLNSIMGEYKKAIADAMEGKKHPELPDDLSTAKLKYLSMKLYDQIITHGQFLSGKSLDEMVDPNKFA